MVRRLFSYLILLIVIGWLVLSYLPATMALLPHFPTPNAQMTRLYSWALAAGMVVVLVIQSWLVIATRGLVDRAEQMHKDGAGFELSLPLELFWTALPLVGTVVLILVYGTS